MNTQELIVQIKHRVDSKLNWEIKNPVLALGEFGIEKDTLFLKIGDGVSEWNKLQYYDGSMKDLYYTKDVIDQKIKDSHSLFWNDDYTDIGWEE